MNETHVLLSDYVYSTPVLCMDVRTGGWRNATDEEFPPETTYFRNAPNPIWGIYVDNSGLKYFRYSNEADDQFFRDSDGVYIEIDGTVYATVEPSKDLAGNIEPEHNVFQLFKDGGQLLYRTRYEATLYRKLYEQELMTSTGAHVLFGDFTPASWDFFYSMIDACNYVRSERLKREAKGASTSNAAAADTVRLRCEAGQPCPQAGYWFTPARENSRAHFEAGQTMPDVGGNWGATIWQWDERQ